MSDVNKPKQMPGYWALIDDPSYWALIEDVTHLHGQLDQLKAENDKLRMFIDLKETCWKYVGWCNECPYNGMDDEHDDCNCTVQEKIDALARELRIETNA